MNRRMIGTLFAVSYLFTGFAGAENDSGRNFSARLTGFNEVPLAILSPGSGTLDVSIDEGAGTMQYTLSYSGVTSPVSQAHIHFGKHHVNGGVIAFLCSNLANPPTGTPACPQLEGTVSGTITSESVVAQAPQNLAAGDFTGLVAAIATRTAYGNVHTTRFPAGELRGQLLRTGQ
ncbi:CHRD domain-containing protein [Noviherbaspirillum saxi]|uniref:CHRD domain-containing protein n=1 Tax=Noviherbaspirillum saxi TaxID=2320863 RepID=A0A3A3FHK9_9BURK|nr:CHRD domain-containing protein [Noviherbaspirillum saxi]RJF92637.1 CHRD domain-containing protein [Noviherbaspirillum saxi]